MTATDNSEINKEPAKILIDKRFDKVSDWKLIDIIKSNIWKWRRAKWNEA